jgi:ribosomal protein S18 acetylase RimI-like enzyme
VDITIRPYRPEDEAAWLRVHAVIMTISHAWNYCVQERPRYEGYESTCLVVECSEGIIGLTDVQYEKEPGELCWRRDSRGGYVLEFGRLPEYAGHRIGERLIEATVADAREKGVHRLEYWSQDRAAQRYYARLGLPEIGRHYRFRMRAPQPVRDLLDETTVGVEYIYAACLPEKWPAICEQYEIIEDHPLEPHLCIGYEVRF